MQQRQLRLGDILDDYCPRERRVTNHAVVAMVGDAVKQTRCTTCETEHEYKHAKVPRQRRKTETPAALYAQVLANGPKRVTHDGASNGDLAAPPDAEAPPGESVEEPRETPPAAVAADPAAPRNGAADQAPADENNADEDAGRGNEEEGPIHRRLIRASLPRPEGQQPPARPIPEFTIRQPGGRPNRFRPRHQRGGGAGGPQFGGMRSGGGRPPQGAMPQRMSGRRHGPGGRKRSK